MNDPPACPSPGERRGSTPDARRPDGFDQEVHNARCRRALTPLASTSESQGCVVAFQVLVEEMNRSERSRRRRRATPGTCAETPPRERDPQREAGLRARAPRSRPLVQTLARSDHGPHARRAGRGGLVQSGHIMDCGDRQGHVRSRSRAAPRPVNRARRVLPKGRRLGGPRERDTAPPERPRARRRTAPHAFASAFPGRSAMAPTAGNYFRQSTGCDVNAGFERTI